MASPQWENGFTKIANEIIDELVKACLLGAELQVCLFIIRKTYGFGKTEDGISLTQFEQGTNKSRPTIVKALKNLQLVNMVELVKCGDSKNSYNIYKFNKNYEDWKPINTCQLVKRNNLTSKGEAEKLVKTCKHTKENTKENTKEKEAKIIYPDWFPKEMFLRYQQSRHKKLKPAAFDLFFKKLQKLSQQSNCKPEEILKQSIENGWEGIFELKTGVINGQAFNSNRGNFKAGHDQGGLGIPPEYKPELRILPTDEEIERGKKTLRTIQDKIANSTNTNEK
jgi:phage replication O-like protein O